MYAYYFPFFCFFLHPLQLPRNETRRNGTSSFRLLSISHHLSLELISTPPSLECDVFRRQRGGFNSLPFCFRAFQCKQGGFNPPPVVLHHRPQERANMLVLEGGGCTRALTLAPPTSTTHKGKLHCKVL